MTVGSAAPTASVDVVLFEHAEETSFLWALRTSRARSGVYTLQRFGELDERLEAHIDGLREGGEAAWRICEMRLGTEQAGEMFAAAVVAGAEGDASRLHRLLALEEAVPALRPGMVAAFGWIAPEVARDILAALLGSAAPRHLALAFACCSAHRIDPGARLGDGIDAEEASVGAAALRAAADLGRQDVAAACARHWTDADEACRFEAARASVLLGDREAALAHLRVVAAAPGPWQRAALELALQASPLEAARALFREAGGDAAQRSPSMVALAGELGDPAAVPALIEAMNVPATARAAADAFSVITGVDVAAAGLDSQPPAGFAAGPTDDPSDPDVAMDPDVGLPWPDAGAVARWWHANGTGFAAAARHLGGQPPTGPWCRQLLYGGTQRTRSLAAIHLALLEPGHPLFPTEAPVSAQRRRLMDESIGA